MRLASSVPQVLINALTVQVKSARFSMSGYPTSMIGPCQEGKGSPDALRRSAGVNSFWFFAACIGFSAVVPISYRTRLPFAVSDQRVVFTRRLSLCFPASLETYQREHPELALLRPVGLTARPGRRRVEEILLGPPPRSTQRCSYSPPPPENSVAHGRPPGGRPPTSVPPPASRDWHCLAAFSCHKAWPAPGCCAAPSLPPRSALSANVCYVVLTAACAARCSPNSSLPRTTRSS